MSFFSSLCKTTHASPLSSFREHTCDSAAVVLSQTGCLTPEQGQMSGTEPSLMEMVEYSHLQHLPQTHVEAQVGPSGVSNTRFTLMDKDALGNKMISSTTASQAIDMSITTDEQYQEMLGERTPASYGEVPGFVLARVSREDSPTSADAKSSTSSHKRPGSAARVCLEKRFNTIFADTTSQQDIHSAVLSNFLTILQQSAETQEAVIHPHMQKWIKSDRGNAFEVSSPSVEDLFNPVMNMCEQVIGHIPHMAEPKHQGLIIPKSFSFNFHSERVANVPQYTSGSNSTRERQLVNLENALATPAAASRKLSSTRSSQPVKAVKAAPDSAGESGRSTKKKACSHMPLSQRRERHNRMERERRKKIRLCCDELNMLVPFCHSDSDKVTTLHWTTAFLRYINKTYGDTFNEEFKKTVTDEKGNFLDSSSSCGRNPIHRETEETLSITLAVEQ